jgi:hypothetical protein
MVYIVGCEALRKYRNLPAGLTRRVFLIYQILRCRVRIIQALVHSLMVVEFEVPVKALKQGQTIVVGIQVVMLLFDAALQALHEHVIEGSSLTVNADPDAFHLKQ